MNTEFKEMLLNKAAGKLIEQISVCDYYLGDSLPIFKSKKQNVNPEKKTFYKSYILLPLQAS